MIYCYTAGYMYSLAILQYNIPDMMKHFAVQKSEVGPKLFLKLASSSSMYLLNPFLKVMKTF